MIEILASAVVVLAGIYLIGLGAASFLASSRAARFLDGFASSARAHVAEMSIRLVVGCSLVIGSSHMLHADAFRLFGWVLIATSALLLLVPWRWHHRFARMVVPPIRRHIWLFGIVSLPLGGFILFAVLRGNAV